MIEATSDRIPSDSQALDTHPWGELAEPRPSILAEACVLLFVFYNVLPFSQLFVLNAGVRAEGLLALMVSSVFIGLQLAANRRLRPSQLPILTTALAIALTVDAFSQGFAHRTVDSLAIFLTLAYAVLALAFTLGRVRFGSLTRSLLTVMCALYALEFLLVTVLGPSLYADGLPPFHVSRVATKAHDRLVDVNHFLLSSAYENIPGTPFPPVSFMMAGMSGEPHLSVFSLAALYLLSPVRSTFHSIVVFLALYFFFSFSTAVGIVSGVAFSALFVRGGRQIPPLILAAGLLAVAAVVMGDFVTSGFLQKLSARSFLETYEGYLHLGRSVLGFQWSGTLAEFPSFLNNYDVDLVNPISASLLLVIYPAAGLIALRVAKRLDFFERVLLAVILVVAVKAPTNMVSFPLAVFLLDYLRLKVAGSELASHARHMEGRTRPTGARVPA